MKYKVSIAKGKMAWLRDRQISKSAIKEDSNEMEAIKSGAHRPRTRSDSKWLKINRKKAVERETFFERLKQKYNKAAKVAEEEATASRLTKSQSLAGLTNHELDKVKLKRRGSERVSNKKTVAFHNQNSWWNTSMKYLFDITGGSKSGKTHKRRRHLSSDASKISKFYKKS